MHSVIYGKGKYFMCICMFLKRKISVMETWCVSLDIFFMLLAPIYEDAYANVSLICSISISFYL